MRKSENPKSSGFAGVRGGRRIEQVRQPLARYSMWCATTPNEAYARVLEGFPGLRKFHFLDTERPFLSSAGLLLDTIDFATVRSSGHDIWLADDDRLAVLLPIAGAIRLH